MSIFERMNPFSTRMVAKDMNAKRMPLNYGKLVGGGTLLGATIGAYNGATSKDTFVDPDTGQDFEETVDAPERASRVLGNALEGSVLGGVGGGLLVGGRYLHNKNLPNAGDSVKQKVKFLRDKLGGSVITKVFETNILDPVLDTVKATTSYSQSYMDQVNFSLLGNPITIGGVAKRGGLLGGVYGAYSGATTQDSFTNPDTGETFNQDIGLLDRGGRILRGAVIGTTVGSVLGGATGGLLRNKDAFRRENLTINNVKQAVTDKAKQVATSPYLDMASDFL